MGSVDEWPLATLPYKIPEGSRPGCAAKSLCDFARDSGVRPLHLSVVCRSQDLPARVVVPICVRTDAEEFSGGNWMVVHVSPGTPGLPRRPGVFPGLPVYQRPFLINILTPSGAWIRRVLALRCAVSSGSSACYLVDSASSHMLVSKIKPCMSKYKHFIL
jgi:hypothetical protein